MAATLTVLYTEPADPDAFDRHYQEVHLPIVRRWEGVEQITLTRISATLATDSRFHLMTQIRFTDRAALDAALGSPAGREAGADYAAIAPPGSFMLLGEV